jgi:protein O-mannosyl-transferase
MSTVPFGLRLVLVAATILVYANSFTTSFHLDDGHVLLDHDRMSSYEIYLSTHLSRPFGALTFWLNALVARPGPFRLQEVIVTGGLRPEPFHVVNLAIHIAAGLTLFGLVRRTLRLPSVPGRLHGSADGLAFAIALVWLVHPLNTMAVTYITQRFESLMGLFFLLTIYAFVRASQSPEPRLWQLLSILAALLGSATKEVMITLPAVLVVYDRTFLAPDWRTVLRRDGKYLGLLTAGCWVLPLFVHFAVHGAADDAAAAVGAGAGVSQVAYIVTQTTVLPHYLRLAVWPSDLSFEYRDWTWPDPLWPYSLAVGLAFAVSVWGAFRGRWYGFLGMWFFAVLSLTSVMPIIDFVAEYRMYLPLIAVVAGIVLGGEWLLSFVPNALVRRALAIVLVVGVASALGVRTWMRNADYATVETLWMRNLETRPDDARAYYFRAIAFEDEGRFAEAEELYRNAIVRAYKQFMPDAEKGLTTLLMLHGDAAAGKRLIPYLDNIYYHAILEADAGEAGDAMLAVAGLAERSAHHSPLKMLAATLLSQEGRSAESEAALAEGLALFPDYAAYAELKARTMLKTPYFANPVGRRISLAYARQAVAASRGQSASARECLAEAEAALK